MRFGKVLIVSLILTIVGYVYIQEQGTAQLDQQPLMTFIELAEEEGLALKKWQVRLKEERLAQSNSQDEFIDFVNAVSDQLNDWDLSVPSFSESEWSAYLTYENKANGTTEMVQVFAYPNPYAKKLTYLLTYDMNGSTIVPTTTMYQDLSLRARQLGLDTADQYVQIQAEARKMVGQTSNEYAQKWVHALDAKAVEALSEETFASISAYNPAWASSIETNGEKMNVQVAVRETELNAKPLDFAEGEGLGAWTTVTIGTPIITIEY